MAIQYPGGTIVNTTFTGATKQDIVSNLETQLVNAGWSVVSGSGSTDVVMQSATTPTAGNFIRVRLRSTNLTNSACINMQNTSETRVSNNAVLLSGAAKTFRIIANKYQWFCFTPGTTPAREYAAMGVPYIPSFLHGVITGEFGWIQANANHEGDTQLYGSFRTLLHSMLPSSGAGGTNCGGLINDNLMSQLGGFLDQNSGRGNLKLILPYPATLSTSLGGYRWHDDSLLLSDPLISWGVIAIGDEAKIRGQLWGAFIASDTFAGDTILTSVDGHNWLAITNSNNGNTVDAKGTLFVAIT